MPYDEELAGRIRALVTSEPELSEKRMFGGLAFLIGGNMAVAASGQGGIMVRVDPDQVDELIADGAASIVEMRGRPMRGWLRVEPERLATTPELARWVRLGVAYAGSPEPKRSGRSG
jgi:hypothetical protein